ncbi:cache domain-containing protein [Paenarthrobacter sp. TYUT067]|uniref:cache domain-containing protein n=1 Tax=Paenarthrobacter sp. TYUT067 TaxID=2926245 RepID=UPI00202FD4A5|nr:cache domain-containing protein [Paenarthrobacter sp. TYUT067]MCM0616878.1 cache domain-containing protein [Paenarthrobacter sp. TYUT067]
MRDLAATDRALERTAEAISSNVGGVFDDLEKIAATVSAVATQAQDAPRRSAYAFLKRDLATFINRHSALIVGAGIAYAPGSLPEAPLWLEWWRGAQTGGEPRWVTHDLNPESLNYYDYTTREWFATTSAKGSPVAVGPYVDIGGINVNIITLCVPAPTPQGTHVLGCDLTLAKLEGVFLRALQLQDPTVVLLGPTGRVIASNNARIASGTLFVEEDLKQVDRSVDVSSTSPARLPWRLITLRA